MTPLADINAFLGIKKQVSDPPVAEVQEWLPPPTPRPRRLLLLSDIHANWHALVAVLRHAAQSYDAIWFLGDMLGYGPRPVECVEFFRACLAPSRRWNPGNHDLGVTDALARLLPDDRPSREALWTWAQHRTQLEIQPALWRWYQQTVTSERSSPISRHYGAFSQVFVHGNLAEHDYVGAYRYPDDPFNILADLRRAENRNTGPTRAMWLMFGHTHMVYLARLPAVGTEFAPLPIVYGEPLDISVGCYAINPGSVGQPRDADPRAAYAVLDTQRGTVTFHRVTYPVESAVQEMASYPLDVGNLRDRLVSGRVPKVTERFEFMFIPLPDGQGVTPRLAAAGQE